ncbi:MAG: hypothetical protein JO165_11785 [Candidatus Eremiobacteraeota bacterium]|nr:hypothetical protein [Candidatus Eremiobacteraeota bacterium]
MKITGLKALAFLCASTLVAACNGSSGSTPSPTPTPSNISGDYSGTLQDAQNGSGAATGTLAQHGFTAGGAITAALTGGNVTAQIALTITPSNALTGAMVIDFANGTTCTFSTAGNYSNNGTVAAINGTYTAVSNCAGDSGTFALNQQCTDSITSADRHVRAFPPKC